MEPIDNAIQKLESFGLSPVEAKIYLFLVGKQAQSILTISKGMSLPRTTIYDHTEKLLEKGLLERVVAYKTQKLKAHPIDILQSMIDQQKTKTDKLKEELEFLKTNLPLHLYPSMHTEVRYYHGPEGFRQMMTHALDAKGGHVGFSELGRVEIVGKKFLTRWMEDMKERQIKDRVIINPKKETLLHLNSLGEHEFRKSYQQTRMIPEKTLYISGDTTIYNNIFAVAWWKKGEVVGVEIENPELVKTQQAIFEILWKLAKPVKMK